MKMEDIIRTYVTLNKPNLKGWCSTVHIGCDHGRKGPRSAFIFTDEKVGFHCYNCNIKIRFDPATDSTISDDFKTILRDFSVPDSEWEPLLFDLAANRGKSAQTTKKPQIQSNIEPAELVVPHHFYKLDENAPRDIWYELAVDYLKYERGIDFQQYPFYLSHGGKSKWDEDWKGRIIIPLYKNGKLIFYQGRDLTNSKTRKYKSPSEPKDKVMSGFDELYNNIAEPLYVVEGFFDSYVIGGVGLIGNQVTTAQLAHLRRCRRDKIYIPDKVGDGDIAANVFIKEGWSISTPEIGSCKDINEAVVKYGKMYVLKTISDNVSSGELAKLALGVYCSNGKKKKNDKGTSTR